MDFEKSLLLVCALYPYFGLFLLMKIITLDSSNLIFLTNYWFYILIPLIVSVSLHLTLSRLSFFNFGKRFYFGNRRKPKKPIKYKFMSFLYIVFLPVQFLQRAFDDLATSELSNLKVFFVYIFAFLCRFLIISSLGELYKF